MKTQEQPSTSKFGRKLTEFISDIPKAKTTQAIENLLKKTEPNIIIQAIENDKDDALKNFPVLQHMIDMGINIGEPAQDPAIWAKLNKKKIKYNGSEVDPIYYSLKIHGADRNKETLLALRSENDARTKPITKLMQEQLEAIQIQMPNSQFYTIKELEDEISSAAKLNQNFGGLTKEEAQKFALDCDFKIDGKPPIQYMFENNNFGQLDTLNNSSFFNTILRGHNNSEQLKEFYTYLANNPALKTKDGVLVSQAISKEFVNSGRRSEDFIEIMSSKLLNGNIDTKLVPEEFLALVIKKEMRPDTGNSRKVQTPDIPEQLKPIASSVLMQEYFDINLTEDAKQKLEILRKKLGDEKILIDSLKTFIEGVKDQSIAVELLMNGAKCGNLDIAQIQISGDLKNAVLTKIKEEYQSSLPSEHRKNLERLYEGCGGDLKGLQQETIVQIVNQYLQRPTDTLRDTHADVINNMGVKLQGMESTLGKFVNDTEKCAETIRGALKKGSKAQLQEESSKINIDPGTIALNYDLDTLQKLYEVGQNLEEEIGQSAFKITGVEKALMVITAVSLIILALSGLGLIPAAVITGAEIIGGIGSVGELSYKGYQYIDNKNTMARQEKEVQDVKERITDKKAITKPEKDECIPDNTIKNAVTILENSGIKSEEVQYVKLENKEVNKFVDMINKGGTGKGRG